MGKTFAQDFEDWKTEFKRFVIDDIDKTLKLDDLLKNLGKEEDNISVGLIILTFSAVDTLSGYFEGTTSNNDTRNALFDCYFPSAYRNATYQYALELLRNSLLHDYSSALIPKKNKSIQLPMIEMKHYLHEPHLKTCQKNGVTYLAFSRARFAKDFLEVWEQYLADISNKHHLQKKWETRAGDDRGYIKIVKSPCNDADWK